MLIKMIPIKFLIFDFRFLIYRYKILIKSQIEKLFSLLIFLISIYTIQAQTILIDEGFENGTGDFTVKSGNWVIDSTYFIADTQSLRCNYISDSQNILELTGTVGLTGYTGAILEFYHIAKVEIGEQAIVQVSKNGGSTWITLDTSQYMGSGIFLNGTNFFDGSHSDWQFNVEATPENTWWKKETFNLSEFTDNTKVKIRFSLTADNSRNFYGWLIDDVKLTAYTSGEFDGPNITHTAFSNTGSTQPYNILAYITDTSGVDSANIYYSINEGNWQGPNTMNADGDTFRYSIPGQAQSTKIDYFIKTTDASTNKNVSYHPENAPNTFHSFEIIESVFKYPYNEDFETLTATQWYHKAELAVGNTGITPYDYWALGKPTKTNLNATRSGNKAYTTDLYQPYGSESRSALISPKFDLSNVWKPQLAFYHKYEIAYDDGGRIDYTINDGFTWQPLGDYFDSRGTNWYNAWQVPSASGLQTRPGWQGYQYNDWVYSTFDLTEFAGKGNFIQFRFAFTSDWASGGDGWEIDDFSLIDLASGIEKQEFSSVKNLFIYPNPSNGFINLSFETKKSAPIKLEIYNLLGQSVYLNNLIKPLPGLYTEKVNIESLSPGIYFVNIESDLNNYSGAFTIIK